MGQKIRQILDEFADKVMKKMEVIFKPFAKQIMELLTLLPTEHATKLALQPSMEPTPPMEPTPLMEPTPPTLLQPPPLASELSIPKVARVAIKHHIKHRLIERIGFRSPLASCSAFVRLSFYPAATILCYLTFTIFACASQWEPSDHGWAQLKKRLCFGVNRNCCF